MSAPGPSSNWQQLRKNLKPQGGSSKVVPLKRASSASSSSAASPDRHERSSATPEEDVNPWDAELRPKKKKKEKLLPLESILTGSQLDKWQQAPGQYLAIDCEMVGLGYRGTESSLARVSIVNYHGHIILDRFVRQKEAVTDYRTWVSGVRPGDLEDAPTFIEVQREVARLITGKTLIGHALTNDTKALMLSHPKWETRDTSSYKPLQLLAGTKRPSLKTLSKLVLGIDIQAGEHSSVIDARATMAIYRSQKSAWEDYVRMRKKPELITSTTITLQSVDIEALATGKHRAAVKASAGAAIVNGSMRTNASSRSLGLSALVRGMNVDEAQDEQPAEQAEVSAVMRDAARKKARAEKKDDLVIGFDFDAAPVAVAAAPEPAPISNKQLKKQQAIAWRKSQKEQERKTGTHSTGVKPASSRREAAPKSKDNWWDDQL